jgi:predicted DNA-binding ArsR family transcriptional regulator
MTEEIKAPPPSVLSVCHQALADAYVRHLNDLMDRAFVPDDPAKANMDKLISMIKRANSIYNVVDEALKANFT